MRNNESNRSPYINNNAANDLSVTCAKLTVTSSAKNTLKRSSHIFMMRAKENVSPQKKRSAMLENLKVLWFCASHMINEKYEPVLKIVLFPLKKISVSLNFLKDYRELWIV